MDKKIAMFVFNNCTNDSRVFKEADTLISAGYIVEVFALAGNKLPTKENRNKLIINRIKINPFHKRIFNQKVKKKELLSNVEKDNINKSNEKIITDTKKKELPFYKDNFLYKRLYFLFRSLLHSIHRPLTYYDFSKKVATLITQENKTFDIFHAHDMNTLYAAYRLAKKQKGKLVYDSHELYIDRNKLLPPSALYKFLSYCFERHFAQKADIVITVGEKIAELLQQRYRLKKVAVIMNAPQRQVDLTNVKVKSLRDELSIPENLKLLIYTGGITFNRGLEQLVQSLKLLPNCYLIMMGYGKESFKKKLKEIAHQENVSKRFSFYGPVKSNEVIYYTRQADLGIAPIINACLSYYYCAPNKIFEYMLGGIPVISSNFPEMEKIVLENNIGYTFNPEQPESIAKAVKKIFSDEEKYKQMKQNTIKAAEKYNWEKEAKKLLTLYNSL